MWDRVKETLGQTLVQLLAVGVIAVATWLMARLASAPPYVIVIAVVFVVACTFWGINQIDIFRDRRNKGFATQNNKKIEATLRKWLDKRSYSSECPTDDTALFHIIATDKQNRHVHIYRPKSNRDVIVITLAIQEEGQTGLKVISEPYQAILRASISVEMARLGPLCHASPPMHIDLELPCDDSMTEHSFWNAIDKIRQGHVLINAHARLAATQAEIAKKQASSTTEQAPHKEGSPN